VRRVCDASRLPRWHRVTSAIQVYPLLSVPSEILPALTTALGQYAFNFFAQPSLNFSNRRHNLVASHDVEFNHVDKLRAFGKTEREL
jgi:hypothetical protein